MTKKEIRYIRDFHINFWEEDSNTIKFKVFNPDNKEEEFITSVDHTNKYDGEQKKRTHDNFFNHLRTMLEEHGKWKVEE